MKLIFVLLTFLFVNFETTKGCGGNLTAGVVTQVLTSPNYPGPHEHNLLCNWTITSHHANVMVEITDVNTEPCCDYLEIFDDSTNMGKFKGTIQETVTFISSGSALNILFRSDGSVANSGFRITYRTVYNCGQPLLATKTVGHFSSPFYPNPRQTNYDCFWLISAKKSYEKVEVTFKEGKTNTCCDYIQVLDGTRQIGKIKGKITNNTKFSSTGRHLGVYFHASAMTSTDGFLASYKEFECGGTFLLSGNMMAQISSPNYPDSAHHLLNCRYNFQAEPGFRVELTLEINTEECCDYIDMYEERNYLGRLKGKIPTSTLVSHGRFISMFFHTDGSVESKGFKGTYRQVLPSCAKTLYAGEKPLMLTSPGYPTRYPNNYRCSWVIKAKNGQQIVFKVNDFQTEACCDYLEVFDGLVSMGRLQGKIKQPITFVSKSSRLSVRFYTDLNNQGKGFTSTYKLAQNCGSKLYAAKVGQNLSTPNYPNDYPDNLDCMWVVSSREGTRVQLNVSSIETEKSYDYVEILDDLHPVANLSGSIPTQKTFMSSSNTMRVYFHSDKAATRDGFQAYYKEVCVYKYYATSNVQFLSSPNFPEDSPNSYECTYQLIAPPGQRISLQVLNVTTEACCDFVDISEGSNLHSILRGSYNSSLPVIQSTTNTLTISYYTDATMPSTGFQLSYRLLQNSTDNSS